MALIWNKKNNDSFIWTVWVKKLMDTEAGVTGGVCFIWTVWVKKHEGGIEMPCKKGGFIWTVWVKKPNESVYKSIILLVSSEPCGLRRF